jgi:hypothetical protein
MNFQLDIDSLMATPGDGTLKSVVALNTTAQSRATHSQGTQSRAREIEKGLSLSLRDTACLHALFVLATSKVRWCTPSLVPCVDRWDSLCVLISTSRTVW